MLTPAISAAHLARQPELVREARDAEAPRHRGDQHQLRPARRDLQQRGEDEPAGQEGHAHQHRAPRDGLGDAQHARLGQARLHRHEEDGPDVLHHQHPQGEAAGEDLELELLAQQLDHDQGRAERDDDGQVDEVEAAVPHPVAKPGEEGDPKQRVDHELADSEGQHRAAEALELAQVDLEPDDEQEQDEADLGDQLDALRVGDEAEAHLGAEQDAARDVAQEERLPEQTGGVTEHRGEDDAEGDVAQQRHVVNHRSPPPPSWDRIGRRILTNFPDPEEDLVEQRNLGKSTLAVSAIGLGCMSMSNVYGKCDDAEAIAVVHRALDLGVNFLDSSDMYGWGQNEELLGRALRGKRDGVVLATKFGNLRKPDGTAGVNGRPDYVPQACEASLKRLGVDSIDLYYQHRVDPGVPIEDTVGAMSRLVEQGKVRYLGLSEASPATVRRAHAVHPIAALQSEFSMLYRVEAEETLPVLRELGISFVAYSPLGRSLLTGSTRAAAEIPTDDRRRDHPPLPGRESPEEPGSAEAAARHGEAEGLHSGPARAGLAARARARHRADPGDQAEGSPRRERGQPPRCRSPPPRSRRSRTRCPPAPPPAPATRAPP